VAGYVDEEEEEGYEPASRQIDVEAPAPSCIFRKCSS